MTKKDYSNWTREELIKELEKFKKQKKYGLVWEDKPEQVVLMCKEKLPVLIEVKDKEIITDPNKPTNILIEGDNYHALSVLNYTHKGKIDVIYIDPPYNTGARDWKYNNDYVDINDQWRHSKWLSMMEKRLRLAKNLLKQDGVLICAIDDNELFALGLLLDEIFGENNRIGVVCIQHHPRGRTQSKFFSTTHEYSLFYAKNKDKINLTFCFPSDRGEEIESFIRAREDATPESRPNLYYPIYYNPITKEISLDKKDDNFVKILPILNNGKKRVWKLIKDAFLEELKQGKIIIKENKGNYSVYRKINRELVNKAKTIWIEPDYDANIYGTEILKDIFGKPNIFQFPKSLYAVMDIIKLTSKKDSIILDFFAGSGTTGHAVLELNKEDGGNRKFILCTNNENNICTDVCYPRIEKVIKGYKNLKGENVEGLGGNLKYFKTDFVDAKPTDKNKKKLVDESTEMLCLKEDCFDFVLKGHNFKIFKNNEDKYLGIIYDDDGIEPFKKEAKKLKKKFVVYVFSLDDSAREEEFENLENVELKPIPAVILNVYKRIFRGI